jgi:hypothetical protein
MVTTKRKQKKQRKKIKSEKKQNTEDQEQNLTFVSIPYITKTRLISNSNDKKETE